MVGYKIMSGEAKDGYRYYAEDKLEPEQGPFYEPKGYHPVGQYPVLCGVCGREEFKVFSLRGQYSTWCVCACGNQFEIHSG